MTRGGKKESVWLFCLLIIWILTRIYVEKHILNGSTCRESTKGFRVSASRGPQQPQRDSAPGRRPSAAEDTDACFLKHSCFTYCCLCCAMSDARWPDDQHTQWSTLIAGHEPCFFLFLFFWTRCAAWSLNYWVVFHELEKRGLRGLSVSSILSSCVVFLWTAEQLLAVKIGSFDWFEVIHIVECQWI